MLLLKIRASILNFMSRFHVLFVKPPILTGNDFDNTKFSQNISKMFDKKIAYLKIKIRFFEGVYLPL
jgi:hypothetical protein